MQIDAQARREELLDAAREEFGRRGFYATGIRDIAARLGMLGGSVYYYIDSKEALLNELFQRSYDPALALLNAIESSDEPAIAGLERLVRRHAELVTSDPLGTALVFNERTALSDPHRASAVAIERRYGRTLEALLRRAQAEGAVAGSVNPALTALALLGAVNWMHRWFSPDGSVPPATVGADAARLLVHGLVAPGTADAPPRPDPWPEIHAVRAPAGAAGRARPGRREEVLAVAAALFAERGYDRVTLQDIGERVGIRKASLYYYVRSKAELLYLVIHEAHAPADAVLELILARHEWTALQKLRVLTEFHVVHRAENLVQTRLLLQDRRSLRDEDRALIEEADRGHRHALRALVAQAQEAGAVRADVHPGLAAQLIVGAVNWVPRWYRPRSGQAVDIVARQVARTVVDGVSKLDFLPTAR